MSRSAWTHTLCDRCWALRNGVLATPILNDIEDERCCQCGKACRGIFIREDPGMMRCKGMHARVR